LGREMGAFLETWMRRREIGLRFNKGGVGSGFDVGRAGKKSRGYNHE